MNASTPFHFGPLEAEALWPDAWRPLERAVARWVLTHGGCRALALAAGWASHAEAAGHTAWPLGGGFTATPADAVSALDPIARAALLSDVLVGDGATRADTPFVVEFDRLYLRRNWLHEVAVAAHLVRRVLAERTETAVSDDDIDVLFEGVRDQTVAPQRDAVRQAVGRSLLVLTGGPGTGKTTTVLRMLTMIVRHRQTQGQASPVIRLAAPTGKAAQRLAESLRTGAERLAATVQSDGTPWLDDGWQACLSAAADARASTLHRLLGAQGSGRFRYNATRPVPADVIVVDEASMVDLALLRALLDAVAAGTVLLLVGDADQLTSVGAGSALLDLVSVLETGCHSGAMVRLSHSFRADRALLPVNEAVRQGDARAFSRAVEEAAEQVAQVAIADAGSCQRRLDAWVACVAESLEHAGAFAPVPAENRQAIGRALDSTRECQLLCAVKDGPLGADAAIAYLEAALRLRAGAEREARWFAGRSVIITRNDPATGLFNGDVGLCLADPEGHLSVWFEVAPEPSRADARRFVRFAPGSLPPHRSAAALTIHKSQGSEYAHVAVLLPGPAEHPILSRQLLYTAVSRARRRLEIWGPPTSVEAALARPIVRMGGLAERLATGLNPSHSEQPTATVAAVLAEPA